jgi:DNA-binding transcriptional LysR family regulator
VNPRFLETFILVAKHRSFCRAAEHLHTTQANVSARIAVLERELGVPLLARNGRDVRLTPQGAYALEEAQNVVRVLADFRRKVCDSEHVSGQVKIGVADSISTSIVPLFIEYLRASYPRVMPELGVDTSLNQTRKLLDGTIHLALLMGPVDNPAVMNLDLINLACAWVSSPDLEIPEQPVDVADLAAYPIISFPSGSIPYARIGDYFGDEAFRRISVTTSNSIHTIINLVKRHKGISVLPEIAVEDDIAAGNLRRIRTIQSFPSLAFHAAYLKTPENPLVATIARIAHKAAADYCATQRPKIAWQ